MLIAKDQSIGLATRRTALGLILALTASLLIDAPAAAQVTVTGATTANAVICTNSAGTLQVNDNANCNNTGVNATGLQVNSGTGFTATGTAAFSATGTGGVSTTSGNITSATGNITATTGTVTGATVVSTGNTDVRGNIINSTGTVTINDTLTVTGAATTSGISNTGTLTNTGNVVVTGTSNLQGAISNSTGTVTIGDTLTVTGAATTNGITNTGNISTTGNATSPAFRLPEQWQKIYDHDQTQIYENQRVLPRVWLTAQAEAVSSEDAFKRIRGQSEKEFAPREVALLEAPPEQLSGLTGGKLSEDSSARIVSYEPNRLAIETKTDTPAVLVEYRTRHQLSAEHWTLLTGRADDVRELAALLGVNYRKDSRGQFAHSNLFVVLDAGGEIVHQQVGLEQDPAAAVATVLKVVKR